MKEHLFDSSPIKVWLQRNLKNHSLYFINIPWNTIFAFSCWLLWKNRNKRQIQLESSQPHSLHQILSLSTEFINFTSKYSIWVEQRINLYVKWHPPSQPFIKLNVDGAFSRSSFRCGVGEVVRNHNGDWIIDFASNFNYASSNQVEFWALKRGLEMATRLGIGKL